MADIINNSLSGVLAFQRALGTTSNNISNSQTEGYSRQSIDLNSRFTDSGGKYGGSGVAIQSINRNFNPFIEEQLNATQADFSSLDIYYDFSTRVTNLIADPDLGITQTFNDFFSSVEELSNDPNSIPIRQFVIEQANLLSDSFVTFQGQLEALDNEINSQLESMVGQVNIITDEVKELNGLIASAYGRDLNASPNELLDQRDNAIGRLNELLRVKTISNPDGTLDVFVPNGQPLVLGEVTSELTTSTSEFTPDRIDLVVKDTAGFEIKVSNQITGGKLGGLLDARVGLIDEAIKELGMLTTGLNYAFNEQHRQGMTLNGTLGQDFFALDKPQVRASKDNVGAGFIDVNVVDVSELEGTNYIFSYDGTNHVLFDEVSGVVTPMTGTGTGGDPYLAKGLSIEVSAAMTAGDRIQVLAYGNAGSLRVATDQVNDLAAQGPIKTVADINNLGSANISDATVVDVTDANFLNNVDITFTNSTSYQVNGAGAFAYTSGSPITINGWEVAIEGDVQAGDSFSISANSSGFSDNRNALALSDIDASNLFNFGIVSLNAKTDAMIGDFANGTRRAELSRGAKLAIYEKVTAEKESISGVNLDEEAANLLRYQQAYQAAAQGISVANSMFQTLLQAVR